MGMVADYGDEHIRTLDWKEHIRRRPGMYIGKLGDGTSADDGIYILIKEVLDNSVDEYMMGFGKSIDITIADDKTVTVRDYGRGVPLGKLVDVASKMNTGAKYDSKAFKKSVGLNGVGIKAVNALSDAFLIRSVRDGEARSVRFEKGNEIADVSESGVGEKNGTMVSFHADESVFGSYDFHMEYVESMVRNYTYLNAGLTIRVNGQAFVSKNGLLDLLQENLGEEPLYPPVHLCGEDIEVVITHGHGYGETYYSFVNGQHTTQGGTHQTAFREGIAKTIKERCGRRPHVGDRGDQRQSRGADVRIADQNETRFERDGPERAYGAELHRRFSENGTRQFPAQTPGNGRYPAKKNTGKRKRAQGDLGHSEKGPRDGQKSEPEQQETARLPHPPDRQERPRRRVDDLHHRG